MGQELDFNHNPSSTILGVLILLWWMLLMDKSIYHYAKYFMQKDFSICKT